MQRANKLAKAGIEIVFLWVPAHIGVRGNEWADKLAKEAVKKDSVELEIQYSKAEIKSVAKARVREKWQRLWNNGDTGRQYHAIQNEVGRARNTNREKKVEDGFSRMRACWSGSGSGVPGSMAAIANGPADTGDVTVPETPHRHQQINRTDSGWEAARRKWTPADEPNQLAKKVLSYSNL
ncbi:uncharacterized protein PAE49_002694 isoform 1-T1 [Odontesthes bonariensis]